MIWSNPIIFSMTSWIVKFPFKVGHLPQFTPWAFNVMRYLRVPLLWSFLPMSMPLGCLWFLEATFLIYASALAFTEFHLLPSWPLQQQQGPQSYALLFSSVTPYMCYWNFTSSITTLHSFATLLSLLASSLFQWSVLVKCHVGFSLGDMEVTQLHALLSVWPEWWALSDPSLTDFERREVIGHWLWCAPVISVVIGGLKT